MKQVFYRARIENRVFFIHKFSARDPNIVSTIKMGLAYNEYENASEACNKAIAKYGLDRDDTYLGSFDKLICQIYARNVLSYFNFSIDSPKVAKYIKEKALYIREEEIKKAVLLLRLEGYNIYNNKNELI